MKHKFVWEDGKEFEFEDFDYQVSRTIYCPMPEGSGRRRGNYTYLYTTAEDNTEYTNNNRYGAKDLLDTKKIRVGILIEKTSIGFPKGCYIPYRFSNRGNTEHLLEGLTGDFIINPKFNETITT